MLKILGNNKLPKGWEEISLGTFRQGSSRSWNPANNGESTFELYSVPSHETGRPEIVIGSSIGSNKQFVDVGDVLISKINPRLNRSWVVGNFSTYPKIASTEWVVFQKSEVVESRFLSYCLQLLPIRDYLAHNASGVGGSLTRVKPTLLDSIFIGLPPVNEQHRIVAKIEELFSELDKGIENLKIAQAQLKVYRQALLKYAFEGKLTAAWREQNRDKLETAAVLLWRTQQDRAQRYPQQLADWEANGKQGGKPKAPKPLPPLTAEELAELPQLPEGWGWVKAEEICSSVRDGTHDTPKYIDRGIPLVTSKNLRGGKIDFSDSQFISEEDHAAISLRSAVDKGDILYAMIGTIGNPVVVSGEETFSIKNVALFKSNFHFLDSQFLAYWLGSATCDKILTLLELLKGTTQKFIPLGRGCPEFCVNGISLLLRHPILELDGKSI